MAEADILPLQRLLHWERQRGGDIYLTQPIGGGNCQEFTWAQAVDEARRIAAYIKSHDWEPGSRVAIMSKNCAWWLIADWAIWMAGHVSVPIYPSLTRESVRQILKHSEARLCFVGKLDNHEEMTAGIPLGVLHISMPLSKPSDWANWNDIVARVSPLTKMPARKAQELATVIYTSGTTGTPKGVMHSFGSLGNVGRIMSETFEAGTGDRVISYLPLAHVAERSLVEMMSLHGGSRIFFTESLETFVGDLKRARPTLFGSVPRLWTKFQQGVFSRKPKAQLDRLFRIPLLGRIAKRRILRELGLDSVRLAVTGAAPLTSETIAWYRQLGLEMLDLYGMTENLALSHASRPGRMCIGYVGEPWPGVEVRKTASGEILMRGPGNMLGYYKDPEKTQEAFSEDGFLRTGDIGEIDAEGRLKITGRAKEQFKTSKGKYVAPSPIENRLGAHAAIEACCVTGAAYPQPFAILMLSSLEYQRCQADAARAELDRSLHEHLRLVNQQLDGHEQLDFVVVVPEQWTVENGLITPTLKIKRAAVEKHYESSFNIWAKQRKAVVWA
jgi:long-chain acyl-CoA synthetase